MMGLRNHAEVGERRWWRERERMGRMEKSASVVSVGYLHRGLESRRSQGIVEIYYQGAKPSSRACNIMICVTYEEDEEPGDIQHAI